MQKQTEKNSVPGRYTHPETIDLEKAGTPMERSADNHIQQEMVASKIAPETPQDEAYTRVDQYTLEIIQQIFPTPNKGLEFTASILRYAQVIQNVLPGLEDMGEQVAVINVRTIRVLAGLIKWGYDTTHKYVTTFCALGLLRKAKQGVERLLVFPLERYLLPESLQPLDNLITKSRPKVQQFTRQVKARLLQSYPEALAQSSKSKVRKFEGPAVYSPATYSNDTLYQSLFHLMESEGIDPTTGRHLSKRIITEVLSQFGAPLRAIEIEDETYAGATGTLDSRATAARSTFVPLGETGTVPQSSHPQARAYRHQQQESPAYWRKSTDYEPESTDQQTKYPLYQIESTDYELESTGQQIKYPQYRPESTPESSQKSTWGRLSDEKVSPTGRLSRQQVAISPIFGEAPAERVDYRAPSNAEYSTLQVSQYPSTEYPDIQAEYPDIQQERERRKASVFSREEALSHIMTTWDILTSYKHILEGNLIDWEADGIPNQLIEQLYADIEFVNNDFKQRGRLVASRAFFLRALEKRCIMKLAEEYGLDGIALFNVIMFRTNRERFMLEEAPRVALPETPMPIEEPQHLHSSSQDYFQPYPVEYPQEDYQIAYNEYRQSLASNANDEYQAPVDSKAEKYQQPVDPHAYEYQHPANVDINEYQQPVDPHAYEYQPTVDSQSNEYQQPVDPHAHEYQPRVDSNANEYQAQEDPEETQSTLPQAQGDLAPQESTPRKQLSLAEIIDKAALEDGLTRLRIPRALKKQYYTSNFLNVYVTCNIKNLFNKIYTDVTLRNDGKMFFAEIFDTARASAAKNWYNKLFDKCSSPEILLAAFVETIIDLHARGNVSIQNPGGLFNKKIAECEKVISEPTLEHINTYCNQPYESFVLDIARFASRESL